MYVHANHTCQVLKKSPDVFIWLKYLCGSKADYVSGVLWKKLDCLKIPISRYEWLNTVTLETFLSTKPGFFLINTDSTSVKLTHPQRQWCILAPIIEWHWVWYMKILHELEKYLSSKCNYYFLVSYEIRQSILLLRPFIR